MLTIGTGCRYKASMKIHDVTQGSDEWLAARCGILTASEMRHVLTPTLKSANNDKSRAHLFELAAQRITGYVEPAYISDDMLRGMQDEAVARDIYAEHYNEVENVGFITQDFEGFTLGYSPDGLVGDDGLIEIKSRRAKFQVETIFSGEVPEEYMLQLQTGLLVTGRKWIDFISYCGGMHLFVKRVTPDERYQNAIREAAKNAEEKIGEIIADYESKAGSLIKTERIQQEEMTL